VKKRRNQEETILLKLVEKNDVSGQNGVYTNIPHIYTITCGEGETVFSSFVSSSSYVRAW